MIRYDIAPARRPVARLPDGLELRAGVEPDDPLLDVFFAGYDRAFVLPNEKEERSGFLECLALNLPPAYDRLAGRYGPFREFVAVAVDTAGGAETIVGGANFICYPLPADGVPPLLALNLNYVFVLPEHRRRGHLGRILAACDGLARQAFLPLDDAPPTSALALAMFMELNDPLRLDADAYALDTGHSGLDQFQRIGVWARMGARIIDFAYVQPPLSATQAADHTLLLAVLGMAGHALSPCLLHDHLARFFAISVLKGGDPAVSPDAAAQLDGLEAMCRAGRAVALLDPAPAIAAAREQGGGMRAGRNAGSLRELLSHVVVKNRLGRDVA